jgi:hypothetical protein
MSCKHRLVYKVPTESIYDLELQEMLHTEVPETFLVRVYCDKCHKTLGLIDETGTMTRYEVGPKTVEVDSETCTAQV